MIRARRNKKAPAVNPVVPATSGEGSRTNPTQEDAEMSTSVTKETAIANTGEVDDVDSDYFEVGGFVRSWSDGGEEPIVTLGKLHVFAGEVNDLVSSICKAKAGVTALARSLRCVDAPTESFLHQQAEFTTNDGETLTVFVQLHDNGDGTSDRLVVLNDYAIRCDDIDDLMLALAEARDCGLAA